MVSARVEQRAKPAAALRFLGAEGLGVRHALVHGFDREGGVRDLHLKGVDWVWAFIQTCGLFSL